LILTIITPVYNGSSFLKACLENISEQWQEGIEHLVIDGGSNDGSTEILQASSQIYKHINWISEKDSGQSEAMNKGINLAKGQWISFLNVDDFYEPGALSSVLNHLKAIRNEGTILIGNLKIWNADGTFQKWNKPSNMTLPLLIADLCEWPFNPSAYFYPKSIHEKIGYFPVKEHFAMDYDFILKSAIAGIKFHYVNENWGNFRLLPDAKTSQDQIGNQSYLRSQAMRDFYFEKLNFAQKMEVRWLKLNWYFTLKLRRIFPNLSK
jgi:glycosyltransferase involved in cell wall biosynthesis